MFGLAWLAGALLRPVDGVLLVLSLLSFTWRLLVESEHVQVQNAARNPSPGKAAGQPQTAVGRLSEKRVAVPGICSIAGVGMGRTIAV